MKTIFLALLTLLTTSVFSQSYSVKVKIDGVAQGDTLYLAGYYGPKQYFKDTARVEKNGYAIFSDQNKEMPGGIYSVVLSDKQTYFEFMFVDKQVELITKKGDQKTMTSNLQIKGSKDGALFAKYLQDIAKKQESAMPFRKIMMDSTAKQADKEKAKEDLKVIEKQVIGYKEQLMKDYPTSFVTKMFKASQEPQIPEHKDWPTKANGDKDSSYPRKFYIDNYWKDVDLSDDRLLRSPILHNRLDKYMTKVIVQHPDSIIAAAHPLIEKTKDSKEIFKYFVHYITNKYEKSNIMGMDAIFVSMAEKYYNSGQAYWMDSTKLAKVEERSRKMKPTLMGKRTPNIILQDTTEKNWVNLYDVKAEHTILYFWDPGCSHCKKETPKLKKVYDQLKDKGVQVYAVCTEFKTGPWKKYVKENDLNFINVSDNPEINENAHKYLNVTTIESLNFRETYDIFSTPRIFLLDKDKKIVAKRIGVAQLQEILFKKLELELTDPVEADKH